MPTMTELLLRMPRNFPTVAFEASAAALAGLRPTVTCAPLTAWTRPITLRFDGARRRGGGAVGSAGSARWRAAGGWRWCERLRSDGAAGCRVKVGSIATPGLKDSVMPRNGEAAYRATLEILLSRPVTLSGKYNQTCTGGRRGLKRSRSVCAGPSRSISRRKRSASSATQPAVGANSRRAIWTNTALPRPATRGRVLWSISMMRS